MESTDYDDNAEFDNDDADVEHSLKERRIVRKQMKEAYEKIQDSRQSLSDLNSSSYDVLYSQFVEVSKNAVHTRELHYDASCMKELSSAMKNQAASLCDLSNKFDPRELKEAIKETFRRHGEGIDWLKIGKQSKLLFTSPPVFNTMTGPLLKEAKVRKVSVRQAKANTDVATTTAEDIEQKEDDGTDEATNTRVKVLNDHLQKTIQFDLLRTLIDPSSAVQSIENFFDYSYLHKEKKVMNDSDSRTGHVLGTYVERDELENTEKKQMVLTIGMKDLQEMSKLLFPGYFANADCRGTYRHPLHRDDELYSASSAHQQVELLARRTAEKGTMMTTTKKKRSPHVRSSVAIPSTSSAGGNSSSSGDVSQKSKRNDSSDVSSSNRMTVSPNENIQQSNQMEEEPTTITMQRKRALPTATDAVIVEVAAKSNQQPLHKASKFKSPRLVSSFDQ